MEIKHIGSYADLEKHAGQQNRTLLLLYQSEAEKSACALENLKAAADQTKEQVALLAADVRKVRDIHGKYGITTAPALLEFADTRFVKAIKGCQSQDYYVSLIKNNVYVSHQTDEKPRKRVIVYTTPTCPHCTNLKNYLRRNQVPFRDVDVSKDQKMAQELVRKSGQQGVPQTEINGRIIVGFDKSKIDQMLGLPS
jgi:glutaredoxin-like YruB-family protein